MTTIIALGGLPGAGKDAVGARLTTHGYVRAAFADSIKNAIWRLNPFIRMPRKASMRDLEFVTLQQAVSKSSFEQVKRVSPDLRGLLQRLGTEVGRDLLGEDVWVDRTVADILASGEEFIVVTDVRFPNELRALRKLGATTVWVERPGVTGSEHRSDTALGLYDFEEVIWNSGSLDDLNKLVDSLYGDDLVPASAA